MLFHHSILKIFRHRLVWLAVTIFCSINIVGAQYQTPILASVKQKCILRYSPLPTSKQIDILTAGMQVYCMVDLDSNGYVRIINIKNNKIGWIKRSFLKPIKELPVQESAAFQEDGTTGTENTELELSNGIDKELMLVIGKEVFILRAGETRSCVIQGGIYSYTASAARTMPLSGKHDFKTGVKYKWSFFYANR